MVSEEGKWSQRRAMVSDAVLPLMRSYLVFNQNHHYCGYSEKNKEEGGSYGYSNRTCWNIMTHARRL